MRDITIQLQINSEKCLYEQIYEHIRQEIREGKLFTGERLPSTRSLADYLQVARSTVEYAYDQLLSEGYIEARPYRGYFVCAEADLANMTDMNASFPRFLPEKEEKPMTWIADFSPHAIEMSEFPFGVWKRITKNILNDGNQELFAQGEPQGDRSLRQTICRYLHSSRGVNCRPEQIIIGAGNDYLILLLEKILNGMRTIAMENPTYTRAYRIFQSMGYEMKQVSVDQGGLRVRELEETDADLVYVMPSHQYPTGAVMPISRRNELLKWASLGQNRFLIEDDYDSEFRYKGKPIPSLQSSDSAGKVIYLGTFSKAIAPAIRVSYMVLPDSLLEKYWANCSFYSCTVSRIDQRILDEFIRDGYFERYLNKMRKIYRGKHALVLELLKPFEKQFMISGDNAGLHLVLTAKNGCSEKELLEKAAAVGVRVYGMSDSFVEQGNKKPSVLLGFGGLQPDELTEGIKRLRGVWLKD